MLIANILGFVAILLLSEHARSDYNLTIVHISDFQSHWFEFNDREIKCSDKESKAGKCFGGFPRLLNLVRDIRKKEKNVIVLSSGQFFLGRSHNPLHGWKIASALISKLDLDAMSLSYHDFSNGIFELSTYLYGINFPVLCANLWASETSFLYNRVNKSAVLDINGEKIGIIGYLHPEALENSRKAASVKFSPEIPAIKEEVTRLENHGINKIIALGHSGYHTDLDIAKNVKGLDIVIGGNSHIVLEEPYDDEKEVVTEGNIHGNYPRIPHHDDNKETVSELKNKTLVLHIPQHAKYVGVIRVTFDENGKVIHEEGEPILLDNSIPKDIETLNYLKDAENILEEVTRNVRLPEDDEILAKGEFEFDSRKCRMQECSLGNLVTDAMLQLYQDNKNTKKLSTDPEKWGHVDAVVFNAGCIRYPLLAGNIRIKDLVHSLIVGDFMMRVYMTGEEMVKMMEHSAEKYDPTGITAPGPFLQISGLRVVYDVSDSPGNRVKKLLVRCENCLNNYEEVDSRKTYSVAMPAFIAKGGDGYQKFQTADPNDFGQPAILLIVEYLQKRKIIKPVLDGRISFLNQLSTTNYTTFSKSEVPRTSTTSTKKMDNTLLVTPYEESEKKNVPTQTSTITEREEINFKSTENEIFKEDKSTIKSQTSKIEKTNINPEIKALDNEKINSTLIISTASDTEKFTTTSLVTPQSVTKGLGLKSNHSKVYHVGVEKSYSYINLMLGRNVDYSATHTFPGEILKINNRADSEKNSFNGKLPGTTTKNKLEITTETKSGTITETRFGITTETKPGIITETKSRITTETKPGITTETKPEMTMETKPGQENINERNIVLNLKDTDLKKVANLSFPTKRKISENISAQNIVSSFSTSHKLDSASALMMKNYSTEKIWPRNDDVDNLSNSSPTLTLSSNFTSPIHELPSPDLDVNFIIGEREVVDVVVNDETSEDTTNYPKVSSSPFSNSSKESLGSNNGSKFNEIKRKFSSFVEKSSLSETEKALINAGLDEVNEDHVIIGDGDLERISNTLKLGMHSYLQNNIAVTTLTSIDEELINAVTGHFNDNSLNSTQLHTMPKSDTEVNTVIQTHFTETLIKEPSQAFTGKNHDGPLKTGGNLNETIANVTSHNLRQNSSSYQQISDINKKHVEEIKDLLVNSVVNSVLDKMKTEIDYNLNRLNSSDIGEKYEGIKLEKKTEKKQLKSPTDEMTSSSFDPADTNIWGLNNDPKSNTDSSTKSFLHKMETEIGNNSNNVNSSNISNKSEVVEIKNRFVKKQLNPLEEGEIISRAADEFNADTKVSASIHDSKNNTKMQEETTAEEKLTESKINAEIEKRQMSWTTNSKKDEAKEDSYKEETGWLPWRILGF